MIELFTDGACSGNPGPGGWGCVWRDEKGKHTLSGFVPLTTNNRMELMSAIKGLEILQRCRHPVTVVSDSRYVVDGITKWIKGWIVGGWKTASKKSVENQDLWKDLYALAQTFENLTWQWTKGHRNNPGNEEADRLARSALVHQQTCHVEHAGGPAVVLLQAVPLKQVQDLVCLMIEEDVQWLADDLLDNLQVWSWEQDLKNALLAYQPFSQRWHIEKIWGAQHQELLKTFTEMAAMKGARSVSIWDTSCANQTLAKEGFFALIAEKGRHFYLKILSVLLLAWAPYLQAMPQDYGGKHAFLRAKEVNWRKGPGPEHPVIWVYRCPGWPVMIRKTYGYWYQVQDACGAIGWVQVNLLSFRRMALISCALAPLRSLPGGGNVVAYLQKGVLGSLEKKLGQWFYVQLLKEKIRGWVYAGHVWQGLEADKVENKGENLAQKKELGYGKK